jgi:hypothetical protein
MWEPAGSTGGLRRLKNPSSYFLAGVAGSAGAAGVADAAGVAGVADFLACFLCFFTFTGAVVEGCSVVDFGFSVEDLSAWAKDRAAARAVPNIKAVIRFILFISP